jgi:hypothetical protein
LRLAALDAAQGAPRHARGLGGHRRADLLAFAMGTDSLAQDPEPGRENFTDGWCLG